MSHLIQNERIKIETDFNLRIKNYQIAQSLGKSKSAVKCEIEKHMLITDKNLKGIHKNRFIHRKDCTVKFVCGIC